MTLGMRPISLNKSNKQLIFYFDLRVFFLPSEIEINRIENMRPENILLGVVFEDK